MGNWASVVIGTTEYSLKKDPNLYNDPNPDTRLYFDQTSTLEDNNDDQGCQGIYNVRSHDELVSAAGGSSADAKSLVLSA